MAIYTLNVDCTCFSDCATVTSTCRIEKKKTEHHVQENLNWGGWTAECLSCGNQLESN